MLLVTKKSYGVDGITEFVVMNSAPLTIMKYFLVVEIHSEKNLFG